MVDSFYFREGLTFDDVLLVPRKGILEKREDADISAHVVGHVRIDIPILAAPMSSVTEDLMANAMSDIGAMGVIHRFNTIDVQRVLYENTQDPFEHTYARPNVACAIGVKDGLKRTDTLIRYGCNVFVLDVAHAYSQKVIDFVSKWKHSFDEEAFLIVGNVATGNAAHDLVKAGADAIKVGIGPGAACTTRTVTGFGVPQLTAIMDVYREVGNWVPIIADGGIRNSGDIVKAIVAGADTVMVGSLLAGADEAPFPGEYFGMASKRVNGHNAPEGIEGHVERTGPVADTIKSLAWGIRSGVSYAGATNLAELRDNAEFIRVSPLAQAETLTRIGV